MQALLVVTYHFGADKKLLKESLLVASLNVWAAMTAQGSSSEPKSSASRVVFLMSYILGVVLLGSFSAQLISYLTVVKMDLPFTTMDEMLKTEFTIGTVGESSVADGFRYSPEGSVYKNVWDRIMGQDETLLTDTVEEGLEREKNKQ